MVRTSDVICYRRRMKTPKSRAVREPSPDTGRQRAAFLRLLENTQREVNLELESTLARALDRGRKTHRDTLPMIEAIASLCGRGGKRLRPALATIGALAAARPLPAKTRRKVGAALELLQAYFLIHDDWMDQDVERRGGPTAHIELTNTFGNAHLGACSAILAGDFALAMATETLAEVSADARRSSAAMSVFAEMQLAAVLGQELDVLGRAKDPELVYELKTASYTVLGPLLLGATLAGAGPKTRQALETVSRPLGVAFQLRDDLIGVFGDPTVTGKPRGADLTAGKNTSLVRFGLGSKSSGRADLERVLGRPDATTAQVARAIEFLESSGAKAKVETRIEKLTSEALSMLASRAIDERAQRLLVGATYALAFRAT